jgi:hypothetical protein
MGGEPKNCGLLDEGELKDCSLMGGEPKDCGLLYGGELKDCSLMKGEPKDCLIDGRRTKGLQLA